MTTTPNIYHRVVESFYDVEHARDYFRVYNGVWTIVFRLTSPTSRQAKSP